MPTANQTRGVVTSIAVTVTYPDGTTKQTTIENPNDRLQAMVFNEDMASAMAEANLISREMVAEWTAPGEWQARHTFLIHGSGIEGGIDPTNVTMRDGTCLICMCMFCNEPVIAK